MNDWLMVGLGVVLLGANAFFVGAEFALISARRTAIEPMAVAGSRRARITLSAMEDVSLMMAGAQLGITICSLLLGALAKPAVKHLIEGPLTAAGLPEAVLDPLAFALSLAIVIFLHVVIGEMVPKNIALARPDRSALVLGPALALVVRVLHPALWVMNQISNLVLRAFGVRAKDEVTSAFTRDEVAGLVQESHRHGLLDPGEEQLLVSALTFEERDASSVLLPLQQLRTVPLGISPHELELTATETGFSRFPVADDGRLVGYLHLKDLLEDDAARRQLPSLPSAVRPLPTVRQTDLLRTVLSTMQGSGAHLAAVQGAEGAVVGVVALEDVLEELVGEVRDETRRSADAHR